MWCYCFSPKVGFIFKELVSGSAPPARLHSIRSTHVHKPLHSFIGVFSDKHVVFHRMLPSAAGAA